MNNNSGKKYGVKSRTQFNNNSSGNISRGLVKPSQLNKGTSVSTTGDEQDSVKMSPEAPVVAQLVFSLTATAGHNGTDEICVVPQLDTDAFPATVSLTNCQFSQANFIKYFSNMSCLFGRILVTTDNNLNWGKQIKYLKWLPTGIQIPTVTTWDSISKNFNYLDQTGRIVEYSGWTSASMFLKTTLVGMMASSTMNFTIDIAGINLPKDYVPTPV